ncbi:MAG: Peptidyl-prolyl cis-trans isomerase PpiD [uncultured Rubrobacteraceae bacterium]|uniref:Peptidyl-prolyl cis-trans isomerase PpiD n=1 Tax=uncultured Rubrobacteraceae bacterium TaxID=349277 RepID=A0A6J4QS70_9ACTN|nr:MAG: Peptidyl-prolyl cis-trans isomerase PpiD [uncultured Rubrobacteraceae bacterium]
MSKHLSLRASFVLCALVFAVLAGCQPADPVANSDSGAKKVATYEGGEVTEGELQQFAQQSGLGELDPNSPEYETAVRQVMPQLVGIEIAKTYAQEEGLTVSDKEVDQELDAIKQQVGEQARASGQDLGNQEAFDQALEQNQISEQQLRQDIRENLPVQQVQERIAGDAEPSEEEVRKFYDDNKDAQFTQPAQRCMRHILFTKDQEKKAEEVKDKLQDGGNFADLARENSQDPGSAEKGGDLGCLGKGETVPPFEEAAFAADRGEIVGPVETEFGYHLIEVTEIREEQTQPLGDVEAQITDQLAATQQEEEFTKWIEDQKEQRDVKYLPSYKPASQG